MPNLEAQKTWIIIRDSSIVKEHSIDVLSFAKILTIIQNAIDHIAVSKYGTTYNKDDFRLYVGEIRKGSAIVPVSPLSQILDLHGINTYLEVATTFESLVSELINQETFRLKLEKEVSDHELRRKLLTCFHDLASLKSPIEIKTSSKQPKKGYSIPLGAKNYLATLIDEYSVHGNYATIQGIIMRIKGDTPCTFTIVSKEEQIIDCLFDSEKEEVVKSLYKKWISVTGNLVCTTRKKKLENSTSLSLCEVETLDNIGRYPLKKPISFTPSYDNDEKLWCLCNDELALYGVGESYNEVILSLEEDIEGHVICFTDIPDDKHSKDSLIFKRKLETYLDFDVILGLLHQKFGA